MDATFEFHITKQSRQKYNFEETLFATDGRLIFADLGAARRFTARIHDVSGRLLPASDLYALGLIDEILHILIRRSETQPGSGMRYAFETLQAGLGSQLDETLLKFVEEFPPRKVYSDHQEVREYLAGSTGEMPHRQVSLEELFLVHIANQNPAAHPYRELMDDSVLLNTAYGEIVRRLGDILSRRPEGGRGGESLYEILTGPSKASPYSLAGQLEFLVHKWGAVLGEAMVRRILRAIDFVKEEAIRQRGAADFRPTAEVPTYGGYPEYERYSQDKDWMPRLVLMAKNSYVWLDQLSRIYGRDIHRLDQIPDEELDTLARRGFTGLWLIGLWERSPASRRIKQMMGDGEAVASAYSLFSYDIAADLGGWDALQNLRARAWQRGIRLSADMVPNHTGIDSTWVIQHPDWFLSLAQPPYPSYSFNGADLSGDERVGIFIEDHYYSRGDAAVVFKRLDKWTGDTRYIYHGNDGTSFPWNDTAQLDYLQPEAREAVIQTILHVARNFPIIRFDAAMTLTKKHIQRLWFPEPGGGGAIPSRAEHGMTRAEFDSAMPEEFWRQVVDRVAAEVPDTLLLAEAFWLMEGYFVRTLGMHRVYNSAFMHMLRDEDNAKYRQAIKNTLEFDPQILKRYVNFMNNPDEKTAVEQFGNGEKYFGVATLLASLPGLPMFGHGQVEGFHEKYGMEFRRARWEERPDEGLVRGHEWRIFPLLHRRRVFAEVEHLLLYDFYRSNGKVDENVFAYSNRMGEERGLIIYHNKYAETRGWIRNSAAYLDKTAGRLRQKTLGEGLDLPHEGFAIFKDYASQLEYIRSCRELWDKGLYVELNAYQCHAFLDWRIVAGAEWKAVHEALNGAGVPSMQGKWEEMFVGKETTVVVETPGPEKSRRAKAQAARDARKGNQKKAPVKPKSGGPGKSGVKKAGKSGSGAKVKSKAGDGKKRKTRVKKSADSKSPKSK